MRHKKLKLVVLLASLLLPTTWSNASLINSLDGIHNVTIYIGNVQGTPKTNSIQATIDGHVLSVVFLENLGQVYIELSDDTGSHVDAIAIYTPNGVNFIITYPNRYIVTFTLENGDMYYGEFEVTD